MNAVVYCRVSTDAQERDGTSLDTQERACMEFIQAAGWRVTDRIRDTASGFNLDRPGVHRLRQLLKTGSVDVIVSYAVDRLSRNQNHIGVLFDEVQSAGAHLEFVTEKFEDTAIGRFILAARAFIAEVEREKIAERTMRGKAERARMGKLPQGTGRGCYGYTYDPRSGQREINAYQAAVVRRIFERYAETRSFSAVSNELNENAVPSFTGGRWYPLTVRTILTNECYTGRWVYRRTRRVAARTTKSGRRHSKVVERPAEEWIVADGACPRIVEEALWQRVQNIVQDPERIRHRPTSRFYALRGRTKCGICGSAMVGQTLTTKGKPYRYYRCRHAYDRNTGRECSARYVAADRLETGIWQEITRVLSDPTAVLQELKQQASAVVDATDVRRFRDELAALTEREKRLVRLFTYGDLDEDAIRNEGASIRQQRAVLEAQLRSLDTPSPLKFNPYGIDARTLDRVCRAVADWLESASDADRMLALEALQVGIVATKASATLSGVLPLEEPYRLRTAERTTRCSFNGDKPDTLAGIPFRVTVTI